MNTKDFQFIFTTRDFPATVAFYRDLLRLPVVDAWDRGGGEQGIAFRAAGGLIVVMAVPETSLYTLGRSVSPQGVSIGLEVEDVDAWFGMIQARGLAHTEELTSFSWGERGFTLTDPNGIGVYIFSRLPQVMTS